MKFLSLSSLIAVCVGVFPFSSFQAEETTAPSTEWVLDYLDTIPDFPIPGVQFKSIGPLLREPSAFRRVIQTLAERYRDTGIDVIAGLDARGFIFGSALAYEMNLPFVMVRKAGKLPGDVVSVQYALEYGKSQFEMEKNSIQPHQKVLIIDDVLATGGTMKAAGELIHELGGEVYEVACLIELSFLKGRENLAYPVFSFVAIGP